MNEEKSKDAIFSPSLLLFLTPNFAEFLQSSSTNDALLANLLLEKITLTFYILDKTTA